jgi:hypothetical protein
VRLSGTSRLRNGPLWTIVDGDDWVRVYKETAEYEPGHVVSFDSICLLMGVKRSHGYFCWGQLKPKYAALLPVKKIEQSLLWLKKPQFLSPKTKRMAKTLKNPIVIKILVLENILTTNFGYAVYY